jgi:hypothetical protein
MYFRFRGELFGLGSNHTKYKGTKTYTTTGTSERITVPSERSNGANTSSAGKRHIISTLSSLA